LLKAKALKLDTEFVKATAANVAKIEVFKEAAYLQLFTMSLHNLEADEVEYIKL
jgi:hypothetical protein